MDISSWKLHQLIGIPPPIWAVRNPIKIYEFLAVINGIHINRDDTILDLGCGKGHWTLAVARKCKRVIGIDTNERQIRVARKFVQNSHLKNKVQFLCGRLEDFSFPTETFDKVISLCVLEHIINLDEILPGIFRILKPGGEFHASVDSLESITDSTLLKKHQQEHNVIQYFYPDSFHQLLQDTGFEVMEVTPILTSKYAQKEFERRIKRSYKHGPLTRFITYQRLLIEDKKSQANKGIMLIGRARRS